MRQPVKCRILWSFVPTMVIVGLPDAAVQESRERVQAAVKNAGLYYPRKRITVNLAPASVRKEGPAYDLPIALGVLIAAGQLAADSVDERAGGRRAFAGWQRAPRRAACCPWPPSPASRASSASSSPRSTPPKPP